jgi:hypothetical protein
MLRVVNVQKFIYDILHTNICLWTYIHFNDTRTINNHNIFRTNPEAHKANTRYRLHLGTLNRNPTVLENVYIMYDSIV